MCCLACQLIMLLVSLSVPYSGVLTCDETDALILSHRKRPVTKAPDTAQVPTGAAVATKDMNILLPPVQLMQPDPGDAYLPDGVNVAPAALHPGAHVQDEYGNA